MTSRNIRSGWSKAGLYPFNPSKVLDTMQEIPADTDAEIAAAPAHAPLQPLLSLTSLRTPTNATSLVALQQKLEERQEGAMEIDPYVQKILNAAKQAIAGKKLLEVRCADLMEQNNEKKTRQHVKERKIGDAKIMGYEEIVEALRARDRKEAEREKKAAAKGKTKKVSRPQATKGKTKTKRIVATESAAGSREIEPAGMSKYCSVFPMEPVGEASSALCSGQGTDVSTSNPWPVERARDGIPWQAPVAHMY